MTEEENSPYYDQVLAGAIEMNEVFKLFLAAGFTEDQALTLVSNIMIARTTGGQQGDPL